MICECMMFNHYIKWADEFCIAQEESNVHVIKNKLQNEIKNHKIGKIEYYKFLVKHHGIKILYHTGLFEIAWKFNNKMESKKRNTYKI